MPGKRGRPRKQALPAPVVTGTHEENGGPTHRKYEQPGGPRGRIRLYGVYRHAGFWVMRTVVMDGATVKSVNDSDINPLEIIAAKIVNAVESEGM
jgi:hypothetical protein